MPLFQGKTRLSPTVKMSLKKYLGLHNTENVCFLESQGRFHGECGTIHVSLIQPVEGVLQVQLTR